MGRHKFTESYADWCNANNMQEALALWDYDKNGCGPDEISKSDIIKRWFKCPRGIHDSQSHYVSHMTDRHKMPICTDCSSFEQYCKDNKHLDWLNLWDYELNDKPPLKVPFRSKKSYYFKCPRGIHNSEQKNLSNYVRQTGTRECNACNSLYQWGIDNIPNFLTVHWSDKNTEEDKLKSTCCQDKVWMKCSAGKHQDYKIAFFNYFKGQRCPYCAQKRVCKEESLGCIHPEALLVWDESNEKTPYDYRPLSNKRAMWKCISGIHNKYSRKISESVYAEFRCPMCVKEDTESILEKKVRTYIENLGYTVLTEYNCNIAPINPKTHYKMPYDNEIADLNLIIEVHGQQHYNEEAYKTLFKKDGITPKCLLHQRKVYDRYKRMYAKSRGYNYLEISYKDIYNGTYKNLIDSAINLASQKMTA